MKKRVVIFALPIAALVLGAGALAFGYIQKKKNQPITWASESPNRAYRVSFTGMTSQPSWPFTSPSDLDNRKVKITASRGEVILVDGDEIYDGDAYDSSFSELYPKSEWLSETTLHLWRRNGSPPTNAISITNESGQQVSYLYIKAGKTNLFLLFDIPPGNNLTVQAPLEHWEDLVGCKGKFDDHDFPYHSIDCSLSPPPKSTIHYNVRVTKDGCSVTGKE
jgi:hypothetical protein